jgi:hypothetical protein
MLQLFLLDSLNTYLLGTISWTIYLFNKIYVVLCDKPMNDYLSIGFSGGFVSVISYHKCIGSYPVISIKYWLCDHVKWNEYFKNKKITK